MFLTGYLDYLLMMN